MTAVTVAAGESDTEGLAPSRLLGQPRCRFQCGSPHVRPDELKGHTDRPAPSWAPPGAARARRRGWCAGTSCGAVALCADEAQLLGVHLRAYIYMYASVRARSLSACRAPRASAALR
eukprot:scaffold1745_cov358-Prasinococcus_capsulatus_cf.AAC.5